jgi:hypothetical protein
MEFDLAARLRRSRTLRLALHRSIFSPANSNQLSKPQIATILVDPVLRDINNGTEKQVFGIHRDAVRVLQGVLEAQSEARRI